MNPTYTNDPLDALIEQHITEARDLRLRRRPVYEGVHDFSAAFENKMERQMGRRSVWGPRLIQIAALAALCVLMVQAGFDSTPWHYIIKGSQWTKVFSIIDSAPADVQAADLSFTALPEGYRLADSDYERTIYTYRFVHADEPLPEQSNLMTSLYVEAHWVGDTSLTGNINNEGLAQVEPVRINSSNGLLLTDHTGALSLIFARNGFEITIHTDRLKPSELFVFAENIVFE